MQVSTFVGLLIGVLVVGYAAGNILVNLYDPTVFLLVVGGGIAATLISDGLRSILGALGAARYVFAAGGYLCANGSSRGDSESGKAGRFRA